MNQIRRHGNPIYRRETASIMPPEQAVLPRPEPKRKKQKKRGD